MSSSLPALQPDSSLSLPPVIADLGDRGARAFVEFFTAQIRSTNTRSAYARAVVRFFAWVRSHGLGLHQVEPVHVATYIEELGQPKDQGGAGYAPSSIKQHLSALKMLGSFLVIMAQER